MKTFQCATNGTYFPLHQAQIPPITHLIFHTQTHLHPPHSITHPEPRPRPYLPGYSDFPGTSLKIRPCPTARVFCMRKSNDATCGLELVGSSDLFRTHSSKKSTSMRQFCFICGTGGLLQRGETMVQSS